MGDARPFGLTLIRHAAARTNAADGTDHGRRLSAAGEREVAAVLPGLVSRLAAPDRIVSSDAARAIATARAVAGAFGLPDDRLRALPSLYLADPETIAAAIADHAPGADHLAVVAHNPGISRFVDWLTGGGEVSLPTLGVVHVEVHAPDFASLGAGAGREAWRTAPARG